jgi:hypothetical protein
MLMIAPPSKRLALALVAGALAVAGSLAALATKSASPAPVAAITEESGPPAKGADGYWRINFNFLADFEYSPPGANALERATPVPGRTAGIPDEIQALQALPVRLQGFMLPLAMEKDGSVKEFLIMRSVQTCCYGATPAPTEWVVVKPGPNSPKVKALMDVPLVFSGKFHVGEVYRDGLFAGIYELDLDRVAQP